MRINQFYFFLHGVRDSNPRPSVLETDILPTKLTPCVGYVCLQYWLFLHRVGLVAPPGIEPGSNL